ncbi:MAG: sensor histidine kinase [bacterium]
MRRIHKILVVDNSPVMTTFMGEVLEQAGYSVRIANTGTAALAAVEEEKPDLALIDRVMPQIDGDNVCRILHTRPDTRDIPLIMISGIAAEESGTPVREYISAYLAKTPLPQLKSTLLQVISDLEQGKDSEYRGRIIGNEQLQEREITTELLESTRQLHSFIAASPNGVLEIDGDGSIVFANPQAHTIFDLSGIQLVARQFTRLFDSTELRSRLERAIASLGAEPQRLGDDGSIQVGDRKLLISFSRVHRGPPVSIMVLLQDITALYESRRETQSLLEEKELLLREVQHRVKNNLNSISGMLQLAAAASSSPEAQKALSESEARVRSVMRIYDTLAGTGEHRNIDLTAFLRKLCDEMGLLFADNRIRTVCNVADEAVRVPVTTAIPIGLILNELVTNASKYAFVGRETGTVTISFERDGKGGFSLSVSDDGVGLPEDTTSRSREGFGLQLVRAQAQQIGAEITIDRSAGTAFLIDLGDCRT